MCDDDTTNGDEKTPSGDLQLFMQYFNRSSLVTCGCWYDDVMVPGLLGGGWGLVKGGWLSKWSRPWLTSTPSTPESLLAELLPPFLNVDSDCQELSPKFPFPQRLTLGAGPSPLPPLFLFLDTLIHFQTIGVPDTQTGASEDIMARLTKVESHQGSDTWTTSAQRYLF